jgi:hypothetical protein
VLRGDQLLPARRGGGIFSSVGNERERRGRG